MSSPCLNAIPVVGAIHAPPRRFVLRGWQSHPGPAAHYEILWYCSMHFAGTLAVHPNLMVPQCLAARKLGAGWCSCEACVATSATQVARAQPHKISQEVAGAGPCSLVLPMLTQFRREPCLFADWSYLSLLSRKDTKPMGKPLTSMLML